jgi:hypothetical protein
MANQQETITICQRHNARRGEEEDLKSKIIWNIFSGAINLPALISGNSRGMRPLK